MKTYVVIKGKYAGRIGRIESTKNESNVMFYPVEGKYPYRVCLSKDEIEERK